MNKQFDLEEGFFLGDWFVEPQLGQLTKNETVVQLEPKIMGVLVYLAENQGKVVRRQQFFQHIWADVNVTEHVLARAISELRRAFNDNPLEPRFIQTIPKIGYRLVMSLSFIKTEETRQETENFNAIPFYSQPSIPINLKNLSFFVIGSLTTIVFLAMLIFLLIGRHTIGHSHLH